MGPRLRTKSHCSCCSEAQRNEGRGLGSEAVWRGRKQGLRQERLGIKERGQMTEEDGRKEGGAHREERVGGGRMDGEKERRVQSFQLWEPSVNPKHYQCVSRFGGCREQLCCLCDITAGASQ